uniref:Putative glycosyltransferase n=1 Tax=viral metagenome TaxID=1070528 RepID=A0A6M3L582_9ZZZZ
MKLTKGTYKFYNIRGTNAVSARNKSVYYMLYHKTEFTHLFFMDSDMWFPKGTLEKLLSYDKDIAGGWYLRKRKGFYPTVFEIGSRTPHGFYKTIWPEGLIEVDAIGTGCLLIKREVLEKIEPPWFEYRVSGHPDQHMTTEDIVFCEKAKKKGFQIWCDGDIRCGHCNMFIIRPGETKGKKEIRPV